MDAENVARMKEHYNTQAQQTLSGPSGAGREGGSGYNQHARFENVWIGQLRKYHNSVKRALIERFATDAEQMLDLCCGRGGDLHKWKAASVKEVLAIDLSPAEIAEAERRYADMKARSNISVRVTFKQTDLLGVADVPFIKHNHYSVVSCMFSAHYFLASEASSHTFMKTVSDALEDGGYFIGTMPEGKSILKLLNQKMAYTSTHFNVHAKWGQPDTYGRHPPPQPFGSGFTFAIGGTVTGATTAASEGSYEYLVFFNVFTLVAKKYNLFPVLTFERPGEPDGDLSVLLDPADRQQPYKHFCPKFTMDTPIELIHASAANVAFAFQKRAPPPAAAPAPTTTNAADKQKDEKDDDMRSAKRQRAEIVGTDGVE